MTPAESQKREALRITSEHTDSMSKWEQAAKVLAHFLRLAESELAEKEKARRAGCQDCATYLQTNMMLLDKAEKAESDLAEARAEVERMENRLMHRGDLPLREEISALRAENEALKARLSGAVVHDELQVEEINRAQASEKAAEAKVARLAEALKSSPTFRSREYPEHVFVKLDYLLAALRETEGGAKP